VIEAVLNNSYYKFLLQRKIQTALNVLHPLNTIVQARIVSTTYQI